jgi:predicted nucleotide-binding protein (sugar kinase/HSP70/actin superfamily)
MSLTVGLPHLFRRHEYPGLWEDFFRRLDINVVFSQPTNKTLFDTGIRMSSGDSCLPLKVLHGHVLNLSGKADAVFVPRFIYPTPIESACPKFCALPDILRLNLPGVKILETPFDLKKGMDYTLSALDSLAAALSKDSAHVRFAFLQAITRLDAPWQLQNLKAGQICGNSAPLAAEGGRPYIAVIGHTYLTEDDFITMNLRTKINSYGYEAVDSNTVSYVQKRHNCHPFRQRLFWGVGVDILGTALTLINSNQVKGLIYVTSFSCGIDSIALELLDRHAQIQTKPRMRLCVDEHTGESGFDTRLEAFFDLLERQAAPSIRQGSISS